MNLRIVYGAPCSGKTTYVRENIGEKDIVYDYDEISRAITYGEHHLAKRDLTHQYVIDFRLAMINRLKDETEIESAWFISTFLTDTFREYVKDMNPEYIKMDATKEECLARLESDDMRPDKEDWRSKIDEWFDKYGEESRSMNRSNLIERRFDFETRALPIEGEDNQELWVEGYAARFNSPTVLFEMDGNEYFEQIASDAFSETKMEDVIFNYNHSGREMARTRNKTLQLAVDDNGLFIRARLDGTEEGRSLYHDIQNGYIDRMSFRFTIGSEAFDSENRTWTILRAKRLYDVSAVDIPAYDDTLIEARKADAEAVARESQRKVETELARQRLALKTKLLGGS